MRYQIGTSNLHISILCEGLSLALQDRKNPESKLFQVRVANIYLITDDYRIDLIIYLDYSHSIVAGGLLDTSRTTRLTPFTSLTIRLLTRRRRSSGR